MSFDNKMQFKKKLTFCDLKKVTCDFDKIAVIKGIEVIFNKRNRGDFLVCEKFHTCFLVLHFTLIVGPTPFKDYAFYVHLKNFKTQILKKKTFWKMKSYVSIVHLHLDLHVCFWKCWQLCIFNCLSLNFRQNLFLLNIKI